MENGKRVQKNRNSWQQTKEQMGNRWVATIPVKTRQRDRLKIGNENGANIQQQYSEQDKG